MHSLGSNRVLTPDECVAYDDLGYVVVPDVIPSDELATIDHEVDQVEQQLLAERRGRRRWRDAGESPTGVLLQLGIRSNVCQQVAQDERVLTLIEDIVRPGIAIFSIKLITKPPFTDIPCHWHQDDAYYVRRSESATRMSVWLPLQASHEENGCLWVVPRSHQWGLQPHRKRDWGQCRHAMEPTEIDRVVAEQAIPVPVPAGAAVLFSARLWHGSKGNSTDVRRRAVITSYQEATTVGGNGAQWKVLRPAEAWPAGG